MIADEVILINLKSRNVIKFHVRMKFFFLKPGYTL